MDAKKLSFLANRISKVPLYHKKLARARFNQVSAFHDFFDVCSRTQLSYLATWEMIQHRKRLNFISVLCFFLFTAKENL